MPNAKVINSCAEFVHALLLTSHRSMPFHCVICLLPVPAYAIQPFMTLPAPKLDPSYLVHIKLLLIAAIVSILVELDVIIHTLVAVSG